MDSRRLLVATLFVAATASCASNRTATPASPAPAPVAGSGVARSPATPPPAAPPAASLPPQGGPPGGAPGGRGPGGRPQLTPEQVAARRDTLNTMRSGVIADLMSRIAGRENRRAGDEFTNVLLMKDSTSANFLKQMDYFGRSLSVGCTFCHAGGGRWDDDTKEAKKTARTMIELVNLINTQGLSKLPPGRGGQTPRISCVTCHRGRTGPGTALMPQ